jgi:prepilin-type N-terminal cleavage/methylation domain-containing protein
MPRLRSNRGFGLVEVLVAIALFAVGIVALADLVGSSQRNAALEEQRAAALAVARGKLEELRLDRVQLAAKAAKPGTAVLLPGNDFAPVTGRDGIGWQASITRDPAQQMRVNMVVTVVRMANGTRAPGVAPVQAEGFALVPATTADGGAQ